MRRIVSKKISQWLLPTVLIMFILEVLTLPLVVSITYSGRSEGPDHILTYTTNRLVWDSATGIDEDGVAALGLFDAVYDDTVDGSGEKVIAPGTKGYTIVRLKNECGREVTYKAVLYSIRTNEAIPVQVSLQDSDFTDTESYQLPDEVPEAQVIRAVTGNLGNDQIQDFDIAWLWDYEGDAQQDAVDTMLGNEENADEIIVGLYITVGDEGEEMLPGPPQTGDNTHLAMYLMLMVISLCALILLVWERRREEKRGK